MRKQCILGRFLSGLESRLVHTILYPFRNIASSTWSTEGVTTVSVSEDSEGKEFTVLCESNHLTAFAVLMDVTGVINVR